MYKIRRPTSNQDTWGQSQSVHNTQYIIGNVEKYIQRLLLHNSTLLVKDTQLIVLMEVSV